MRCHPKWGRNYRSFLWFQSQKSPQRRAIAYKRRAQNTIDRAVLRDIRRGERRVERGLERYNLPCDRQRRFVWLYFNRVCAFVKLNPKARVSKKIMVELACSVLNTAGYRTVVYRKSDGSVTHKGTNLAKTLLALPRTQEALDQMFDSAGLSLSDCAEVIKEIALDKEGEAGDRLRAIDMRIRMTTGYAPTRTQNLNVNTNGDRFFDAEIYGDGAPPDID